MTTSFFCVLPEIFYIQEASYIYVHHQIYYTYISFFHFLHAILHLTFSVNVV
jgi:hypothetical protein